MKNTMSKAVWGVFFVLLGIALAGRAFGVFDFNIFFPGWWTLFIIVPSAIGLVNSENRTASIFGLGVGILLLIVVQGFVDWYTFPRLIIALIFVVIGCSFLFRTERRTGTGNDYYSNNTASQNDSSDSRNNGSYSNNKDNNSSFNYGQSNSSSQSGNSNQASNSQTSSSSQSGNSSQSNGSSYNNSDKTDNYNSSDSYNSNYNNNNYQGTSHDGYNHYSGFLSGRNIQFVDEVFTGAVVTSILGNVQLDLRNAILNDDVVVETTCILGGVDVYVPGNAKVVMNCTPILGGVESKVVTPFNTSGNMHTIFIKGTCILGGIEVK